MDASYQVSIHLAKRFQRKRFCYLEIREDLKKLTNQKQELPVVTMFLSGSDEMSNLYRGPSIDASYQVSVHLAMVFQRRRLKYEKLTNDGRQVMAKVHLAFSKVN
jgi:predicted aminopeptidase